MSNEDEARELAQAFFSLWQQQCAAYLQQPEMVGGALRYAMAASDVTHSGDQKGEGSHAVSDDAVAGLFRYLVAQLPQCGNRDGTGFGWPNSMEFPPDEAGQGTRGKTP